jgi:hypothetical protein
MSVALVLLVGGVALDAWQAWFSRWRDSSNIVMDDIFLPKDPWGLNAEFQLSEFNQVDTTDNSHPFRVSLSPQFSFGANDGDNSMGFLGESGLNSEYGLSYSGALAWTVCWTDLLGWMDECDMMLNPALPWQLVPDDDEFFQSTALHEAGHIRGLDHYNRWQSMQNSGTNKKLRDEVLYMDDKEGIRASNTFVSERDLVVYRKWHTGLGSATGSPAWMTVSPTTVRTGQIINFNDLTVENRGTLAVAPLRIGFYLSTNDVISTSDTLLNTGSWSSFGRNTFSSFDWSATVPTVTDCGTRYVGAIVDDNGLHAERFEGNNAVAFSNGTPTPVAISVLLARDPLEANDSFATARAVTLPFGRSDLSLDSDTDNDYYRFTLAHAARVAVTLAFTHSTGDVNLQLLNSGGSVIAASASTGSSESIAVDVAAGSYTIRVHGNGTGACNRYTITASATLPAVTVTATDASASEFGGDGGMFRVARTGGTGSSLTVAYTVGGTATPGTDYTALSGSLTIPAGAVSGNVLVSPRSDAEPESAETVALALAAQPAYTIGSPSSAVVTIVDGPDLVVSVLNAATKGGAGLPFTINSTVVNHGSGPAASSTTRFYLSGNATLDGADALIGSRAVPALAAGASSAGAVTVTMPAATTTGKKYIFAVADGAAVVAETDETNNTRRDTTQIGPDLVVSSMKLTGTVQPGASLPLKSVAKNAGGGAALSGSELRIYLSADKAIDASDTLLLTRTVLPLGPGAVDAATHTVTIPRSRPPGPYFLVGLADATGAVVETKESNNRKAVSIAIVP